MWSCISEHSTSVLLGAVIFAVALWHFCRRPHGIPPGPGFLLPIFGHIFSVGIDPRNKFREWRKKYGDIFSLYLGSRLVIVINGHETLVDAFVKHGDVFSDRPRLIVIDKMTEGMGIVGTSGTMWKEQRRFTLSTLRDFGMGKKVIESAIQKESVFFLKRIEDMQGEKFNVRMLVNTAVANIISNILLGKRFDYEDTFFKELLARLDENIQSVGATAGLNFIPIARYIPGDPFKFERTMNNSRFFETQLTDKSIDKHLENHDEDNIHDFMSAYIQEIRKREETGEETSFGLNNLKKVVGDLVVAGSETTTTTIRWTILLLMKYPQIQEKCFQDIKDNIGLERAPQMSDKLNLPYIEAMITEVQRLANIVPLSLWHSVPHDVTFRGFLFPKGVIVLPNLHSVLHDPTIFENPEEFRPERFLDENGKFEKPPEMIPFFIGKRSCPGESLARMELFLFVTALVQRFRFEHPEGEPPLTMEAVPGVTFAPKPFKMNALIRSKV